MKCHRFIKALFVLLALGGLAVQAQTEQQIVVLVQENGNIVADRQTAEAGQTVTLTVNPAEGYRLRNGSLVVEQVTETAQGDKPQLVARRAPAIGGFVNTNRATANTYTFIMPSTGVEIKGYFKKIEENTVAVEATTSDDSSQTVTGVAVSVAQDEESGGVLIDEVVVPAQLYQTEISVNIPTVVTDAQGNQQPVRGIAAGALYGQTNVTDVYLPETDEPLDIAENAFQVDSNEEETHQVVTVHTPLSMLDDYALMASLSENYQSQKVSATANAKHRYWTFSCGVDVKVPEGVTFYSCRQLDDENIEIEQLNGEVIKANNGVLIACADDEGNAYEMVAVPSVDRPSGTTPATHNARTYGGNMLEPVINSTHYGDGGYFIMANNEFYPILSEGEEARIPACKAVLHLPESHNVMKLSIKK